MEISQKNIQLEIIIWTIIDESIMEIPTHHLENEYSSMANVKHRMVDDIHIILNLGWDAFLDVNLEFIFRWIGILDNNFTLKETKKWPSRFHAACFRMEEAMFEWFVRSIVFTTWQWSQHVKKWSWTKMRDMKRIDFPSQRRKKNEMTQSSERSFLGSLSTTSI